MVAKPYSSSHIAAVSSHFTTMRLSGDVKDRLVTLLCEELDRLVPRMEDETLTQDPERKTLDDPRRSRLNYNRTRELMIDRIKNVESVGSAAVQAGIDHLEQHLAQMLRHAAEAAERDRVATIKPRHLDRALLNMKPAEGEEGGEEVAEVGAAEEFVASQAGGLVTPTALLSMAKSIAKMGVTQRRPRRVALPLRRSPRRLGRGHPQPRSTRQQPGSVHRIHQRHARHDDPGVGALKADPGG